MNRKGIGGFMEAIMAMMAVCVALTAFMGLMAYSQTEEVEQNLSFEDQIKNNTYLEENEVFFDDTWTERYSEKYGLEKINIRITVKTVDGTLKFKDSYEFAEHDSDTDVHSDTGTFVLYNEDGSSCIASYEVAYWYI